MSRSKRERLKKASDKDARLAKDLLDRTQQFYAKNEGDAIDKMHIIGPVQAKRLRVSKGEKHRTIG
jgi:hypothetical protein